MRPGLVANLSLAVVAATTALIGGEVCARLSGLVPGYVPRLTHRAFRRVDRLVVSSKFRTDGDGIFKADPSYPWPAGIRINSEGFRSVDFDTGTPGGVPRVLFIGDSHTWGAAARPITESFVDRVGRSGYLTFNLGIPGTGPSQYARLASRYIPQLRPAVVVLVICLGNDLRKAEPARPFVNLHHVTNAGWLRAFDDDGHYLSPQQAYALWLERSNALPNPPPGGILGRWLARTVVGSRLLALWTLGPQVSNPRPPSSRHDGVERREMIRDVRESLDAIRRVAQSYGAGFLLVAVPLPVGRELQADEDLLREVFAGFDLRSPTDLRAEDFEAPPGGHMNTSGHARFADFVRRLLPGALAIGPGRRGIETVTGSDLHPVEP